MPFSSQSAGEARRALDSWLSHHGSSESAIHDARLVLSELVSNAVRHADPLGNSTVLVRWSIEGRDLALSVCDGGGRTRPALVDAPPEAESGRGIAIVEALCRSWRVERANSLHCVHVLLALD